ncbi:hypothetical protein Tco_1451703, partial [Tanacetum coccineum]
MLEYMSEYETGIQVQTQLESDVTMARRRHGNHADMQFVFIPQTKPALWRTYLRFSPEHSRIAGIFKSYRSKNLPKQESPEYSKVTGARIYLNKLAPS